MTNGTCSLMKVESIAECPQRAHSVILLTCIKRLLVLKTNFLSFERPFYTGFTVYLAENAVRFITFQLFREGYFSYRHVSCQQIHPGVVSLIPAPSHIIRSWRLIMKYFLTYDNSPPLILEGLLPREGGGGGGTLKFSYIRRLG